MIGLRSWVLRVKILRVSYLSLSLASGHKYFGTALSFLNDILHLLFLALLRHAVLNKMSDIFILIGLFLIVYSWDQRLCKFKLNS